MPKRESFGFVRVGTAVPRVQVADCKYNAEQIVALMNDAEAERVAVLVFPELSITAYTCGDLFQQQPLRNASLEALDFCRQATETHYSGLAFVGMPLVVGNHLFNCAVALQGGKILGVVPKSCIPNYKEFYERRWFSPARQALVNEIELLDQTVPFGADILFDSDDCEQLLIGVEICEDLWVPVPPSSYQALAGATLLLNLSASNELIGKAQYRRQLVSNQSGRCLAAYAYSSCGTSESSTDLVFSGHCLIAENGTIMKENARFESDNLLMYADLDFERLAFERLHANSFGDNRSITQQSLEFRRVHFSIGHRAAPHRLQRKLEAHPFVPQGKEFLAERCEEIFKIQVAALSKRLSSAGISVRDNKITIGVSGGLDSTLSLLVLCKTMDELGLPRKRIQAFTMPGFGTTGRTKTNALALMKLLGLDSRELDIRNLCFEEMRLVGHKPFGIDTANLSLEAFCEKLENLPEHSQDLTFENVQARMRTSILMNSGFVVGTGDVSELALGWCTYNADHMSMYNTNVSIPKTLVKFLVDWVAQNEFEGETREILHDIVQTEISPELLPAGKDGKIAQKTESSVGPYELNDFFLFHLLRFGMEPQKILYLAQQVNFNSEYSEQELRKWLTLFVKRFFNNQFKRSCLPDGPKVGSVSLSPRGDWRMPSDAKASAWLKWLEATDDHTANGGGSGRDNAGSGGDRSGSSRDIGGSSGDIAGSGRDNAGSSGDIAGSGRDNEGSSRDKGGSSSDTAGSGRDSAGSSRDTAGSSQDNSNSKNKHNRRRALGLVDPLNGFGSATHSDGNGHSAELPVPGGEEIGPLIGALQEKGGYDFCFAGVDEHPQDMFNFASQCPGKKPYIDKVPDRDGKLALVYPDHCQKGSWSAGFLPGVRKELINEIYPKGYERDKDSHSICGNPHVIEDLKKKGITDIDLVGLVFRICVGLSAIDLARAGFKVRVLVDATRDLDVSEYAYVIKDMQAAGIEIATSEAVLSN
jgi:NAD+ synthase (glutamine-hydrolysing)